MKASIIISYHRRETNLKILLGYLSFLKDYEIVIVEQDLVQTIQTEHKYVFLKNNGVFNKSLAYNVGVKVSESDILIFIDVDVLIKKYCFEEGLCKLQEYDVYDPYKDIYYLAEDVSFAILKDNDFPIITTFIRKGISTVISGGCFFIKKSKFLEIGGFDDNIYGFGYEDAVFDLFITRNKLKIYKNDDYCVHLYHSIDRKYKKYLSINKEKWLYYVKNENIKSPVKRCLIN